MKNESKRAWNCRFLCLLSLFTFVIAGVCLAEDEIEVEVPPPEVSYIGYATDFSSEVGVIETSVGFYCINEGQKLGDYRVLELTPGMAVFGYEEEKFEVPAVMASPDAPPTPGPDSVYFAFDCDLVEAVRALAKLSKQNTFIAPDVAKHVEVGPSIVSSQEAIDELLAGSPYISRVERSFTLIGTEDLLSRVARALWKSKQRGKQITLDFKNADLVYVIDLLARESGQQLFLHEYVQGSVTILCNNVPTEDILALVLASDDHPYEFLFSKSSLMIADAYAELDGYKQYLEIDGGELVSINPEGFSWDDTEGRTYFPVMELLELFAARAGLEIEGELEPSSVGVSLRFCSSLRALHLTAGLAAHDCIIRGKRVSFLPNSDFVLLQLLKEPDKAQSYLERVVEKSRKYRGRFHTETGKIFYAAYLFYDDRDLAQAVEYLRESLKIHESEKGDGALAYTTRMSFWRALNTLDPAKAKEEHAQFIADWSEEYTMEVLLEVAPSRPVALFLIEEYPRVKFTPFTPSDRNGFWMTGPKEDLLLVKRELANLDRMPSD